MKPSGITPVTHELITRLQANIHHVLAPYVPASGKIALLDFPDHPNVGDSAIWSGEIEYFRKMHNIRPAYVCTFQNICWETLNNSLPEGVIFLHGGGNFGDIWPAHQEFREQVLERLRNRKIVQLPQSLYFSNPEALKRAAGIINAHPDFTLLVRDRKSLAIAKQAFNCRVELCPDMAFCLGAIPKPVRISHKLLLLLRTDKEQINVPGVVNLPSQSYMTDWPEDDPSLKRMARKKTILKLFPRLSLGTLNRIKGRELYYRQLAKARIDTGLRLLSSAQYIITDRLHVHILSILLGIRHSTLDNSYGKLSSFIEAWTKECDITTSKPSIALALSALQGEQT